MKTKNYAQLRSEILESGGKPLYADLLLTTEWRDKREKILLRDNLKCTQCLVHGSIIKNKTAYRMKSEEELLSTSVEHDKAYDECVIIIQSMFPVDTPIPKKPKVDPLIIDVEPNFLHVHHTYYINHHLPWEYDDESLITLCSDCHQTLHNENNVPVYEDKFLSQNLNYRKCIRCSGSGYVSKYHYYINGICFGCNGSKYEELIGYQYK